MKCDAVLHCMCIYHNRDNCNPFHFFLLLFRLYSWSRGWVPSHLLGLLLLSLPILCVYANFDCSRLDEPGEREFYLQLVFFGIIHFCNLTALNNWVKSIVATVMAGGMMVLVSPLVCGCYPDPASEVVDANSNSAVIAPNETLATSADNTT